mgnify:CR=1 FL=1
MLEFKRKELYYLLAHYYTDYELSPIVHSACPSISQAAFTKVF